MGHLSDEDRGAYSLLREQQILVDVDSHRLDLSAGVILVACSDGDQLPDIFNNLSHSFEGQRQTARIHTIALNGGALLLPADSPLVTAHREDEVLLEHIRVARKLKDIDMVALYTHAPCGAGTLAGLTLKQEIDLLLSAKLRIKEELSGAKVACFCHIDRGDGKHSFFDSLLAISNRVTKYLFGTKLTRCCKNDHSNGKRTYFVSRNRWILMNMYPDNPGMWNSHG